MVPVIEEERRLGVIDDGSPCLLCGRIPVRATFNPCLVVVGTFDPLVVVVVPNPDRTAVAQNDNWSVRLNGDRTHVGSVAIPGRPTAGRSSRRPRSRHAALRASGVEWLAGDAWREIVDRLVAKHTSEPCPGSQDRTVAVIEPERQHVGVG
jgi:hypothetical protein